jgi:two-component system response regulator HydG
VGSDEEVEFDVRVLAATHRDLETDVEDGRFRPDLFYRINVIQLHLPPLRARGSDILRLATRFIEIFAERSKKKVSGIAEPASERLLSYSWPGNVRELRNVMERAVALTPYDKVTLGDLPDKIRNFRADTVFIGGQDPTDLVPLEEVERRYIEHVLKAADQNRTQAAKILGLDRKTLYRKLKAIDEE